MYAPRASCGRATPSSPPAKVATCCDIGREAGGFRSLGTKKRRSLMRRERGCYADMQCATRCDCYLLCSKEGSGKKSLHELCSARQRPDGAWAPCTGSSAHVALGFRVIHNLAACAVADGGQKIVLFQLSPVRSLLFSTHIVIDCFWVGVLFDHNICIDAKIACNCKIIGRDEMTDRTPAVTALGWKHDLGDVGRMLENPLFQDQAALVDPSIFEAMSNMRL